MRSDIRRADSLDGLHFSPSTPKGQIVYSTIREVSDPNNPTIRHLETITPEQSDAVRVLKFLDEINGVGWTSELERIERELREALHDFMGAK